MSTKLYKNTEGKVLMSVGNKLIKQPYEFGRGLTNNGLLISNIIDLSSDFSFCLWYRKGIITNYDGIAMFMITGTNTSANSPVCVGNGNNAYNWRGIPATVGNTSPFAFYAITKSGSNFRVFTNNTITLRTLGVAQNNYDLWIGRNWDSGALQTLQNGGVISEFSLFNRVLTDSEIYYRRNNMLGNNFQTDIGLIGNFNLNNAEILDFSPAQDGTDMRVGCRNTAQNKHASFFSLPAGTLTEKLTYANENYFRSIV